MLKVVMHIQSSRDTHTAPYVFLVKVYRGEFSETMAATLKHRICLQLKRIASQLQMRVFLSSREARNLRCLDSPSPGYVPGKGPKTTRTARVVLRVVFGPRKVGETDSSFCLIFAPDFSQKILIFS